jgi:hypothetical protein
LSVLTASIEHLLRIQSSFPMWLSMLESFQPMPTLRQLDIGGFTFHCNCPSLLCQIHTLAPGLTQVRLPSIHMTWSAWLSVVVHDQLLPSTVQQIFIQPLPRHSESKREHYRVMMEKSQPIAAGDERIVLMMPKKRCDQTLGEAQSRWAEKIGGGSWWNNGLCVDGDDGW